MFEFKNNAGRPEPVVPFDASGKAIIADGRTILSLEQAERAFDLSADVLRQIWEARFGQLVPSTDLLGNPDDQKPVAPEIATIRANLSDEAKLTLLHQLQHAQLSVAEFELFVATCQEKGFSPFSRHMVPIIRADAEGARKVEMITTMEALRLIAQLSPHYAGRSKMEWCDADGNWTDVWLKDEPPAAARCTTYRLQGDQRLEFPEIARWAAYAPYLIGEGGEITLPDFWKKMHAEQLAKCCEARGLRAALGADLKGLYIREEMEQARVAAAAERNRIRPRQEASLQRLSAESQVREIVEQAGETQLSVFDMVDDPPTDELDFMARLAEIIPSAHVRTGVVDEYRRKWAQQYRANRQAFWSAVLAAVSQSFARGGSN